MAWAEHSIAEIGSVVTGRTPPGSAEEYFGGNLPFLTPTDMDGSRSPKTARSLSELGAQALARVILPKGVAVSCIGSQMGKAVIMRESFATNQQINSIFPNESKVSLDFLYYVLAGRKEEIHALGSGGSTMPIVNKSLFERIKVPIPTMGVQNAITAILGTLDDKIELNRRTNETLEAMARAIFKSWFVDFDPVKAKAAGQKPFGMDDETAALFPSEFEDSELGPIPKGWRISALPDVSDFQEGPGILAKDFVSDGIPLIRLSGLKSESSILSGCDFLCAEKVRTKWNHFRLKRGDILLSASATLGRMRSVDIEGEGCIAYTGIIRFRSLEGLLKQEFLKYSIDSPYFQDQVLSLGTGSVLNHFGPSHLKKVQLTVPALKIQMKFSNFVRSLNQQIELLSTESFTLAQTRDLLLPKLLSGEISVESIKI